MLLLVSVPCTAEANMGTPLMWGGFVHLVFGNFFIGVGEGLALLLFRPRCRWWTCVLMMIVANYFSAWGGGFLLAYLNPLANCDINSLKAMFWTMVVLTYLMTFVLEGPFLWLVFRQAEHGLKRAAVGSLVVQTLSYLVIFGWYASCSSTSALRVEVVSRDEMSLPTKLSLRYLSLDGEKRQENLSTGQCEQDPAGWQPADGSSIHQPVAEIGSNHVWNVHADFWAWGGLRAENAKTGDTFRLALDTPFVAWPVRNVVQLPDEKIVFAFGRSQICVADPERKQVALLVHGSSPEVNELDARLNSEEK